jgi:hypothetical protein
MIPAFEDFKSDLMAQGFDEVLVRDWTANTVLATHGLKRLEFSDSRRVPSCRPVAGALHAMPYQPRRA